MLHPGMRYTRKSEGWRQILAVLLETATTPPCWSVLQDDLSGPATLRGVSEQGADALHVVQDLTRKRRLRPARWRAEMNVLRR